MPEVITKIQQKIADFWKNLDKSQKSRLYITSLILVGAIAASIILLTRPSYVTLISNADAKEINEMVKILDEKKIWNRIDANGTSIVINAKDNNRAHVELAVSGYPKGGMTFDDAYKYIKINTTESVMKQIWDQYKRSSLEAQLKLIDVIKDARVELAMPEKSIFNEKQRPTAAVTVTPKETLTPKQIEGIIMLVSRSVENLDPNDVSVVDNNLNVLNNRSGDSMIDAANTQEGLRLNKATELEDRVYRLFSGQSDSYDTIRVAANPVLDFTKQKSQIQDIANPDGMEDGATISSQKTQEKVVNNGVNGSTGLQANPGTTAAPSYQFGTGENSTYDKKTEDLSKKFKETYTEVEKPIGDIIAEKSSMSVTLWYGKNVKDDTKLTPDFINTFINDVSKATGIPAANISVSKHKLAPPEQVQTTISDTIKELIDRYGFFTLMLILIIGLMIAMVPRKKRIPEPEPVPVLATAEEMQGAELAAALIPSETLPDIELEERSEVKKQIEKFVKQKPEAVAQLLRNWLSEEWE